MSSNHEEPAALVIQRFFKLCHSRQKFALLVNSVYETCYDEETGYEYYYNHRTSETRWEVPIFKGFISRNKVEDTGSQGNIGVEKEEKGYSSAESKTDDDSILEFELEKYEPKAAPFPNTNQSVFNAWRAVFPDKTNPNNAMLVRYDVFSCDSPLRCVVVEAHRREPLNERRPSFEHWSLYQSFFAYNAPVPHSTRYSVYETEKPYRCMVKMDCPEEEINGWKRCFNFWAYYSPMPNTIRFNVQEVVNPIRNRISFEKSLRGGWAYKFCLFAYPTKRISILDSYGDKHGFEQSKVRIMEPHEHDLPHPEIAIEESDHDKLSWCRCFEFFAFNEKLEGTNEFYIMKSDEQPVRYRIAMEILRGWDIITTFFAYTLPVPGTTRYYVHVARCPNRYKVSMDDSHGPWKCFFSFYAYSSREKDQYAWKNVENDVWRMLRD